MTIVIFLMLLLVTCDKRQPPTVYVSLASVFDNYFEDHTLHEQYGWYARKIKYTLNIYNPSSQIVFLPFVSKSASITKSYIDVSYNKQCLPVSIEWLNINTKKQHNLIMPHQHIMLGMIVTVPHELEKHALHDIVDAVTITYRISTISKIFFNNILFTPADSVLFYYREHTSCNQLCVPLM